MELFDFKDTTPFKKTSNLSGKYSKDLMDYVGQVAERKGIRPSIAKAMLIRETRGGKDDRENVLSLNQWVHRDVINERGKEVAAHVAKLPVTQQILESNAPDKVKDKALRAVSEPYTRAMNIDIGLDYLAKGYEKYGKNPEKAIQFYNGMGKVKGMYGVKGTVDMSKNPLYGKHVLALAKSIEEQESKYNILNGVKNAFKQEAPPKRDPNILDRLGNLFR